MASPRALLTPYRFLGRTGIPNFNVEKEIVAEVTLTLNKENELVVLSVDAENTMVENYIKSRLNYKLLNVKPTQKIFKVPVRLKVLK